MKHILITILIFIFVSCTSTNQNNKNSISIAGSTTMLAMTKILAAEFMLQNPGTSIYVNGGGTINGFKELSKGKVDICMASRAVTSKEISRIAVSHNTIGVEHLVGRDALAIYLHPYNPIDDLTLEQVKDIYTCKIRDWTKLGGNFESVIPLSRPTNSGTQQYFKTFILKEENYCSNTEVILTNNEIIDLIATNTRYIGYGTIYNSEKVKHAIVEGYAPTIENIRNGNYPIVRFLHYYTIDKPQGLTKDFLRFTLTEKAQRIIDSLGFQSLW